MVENAHIIKMTGPELKRIWENSKLPDEEIKPIFGISRATLYNRFKEDEVEPTLEEIVDKHPILSKWKNKLYSPVPSNNEAVLKTVTELMPLLANSMTQMVTQSLSQVTNLFKDQMDRREKDYEIIRKNEELHRRIVEQGVAEGAIVFQSPKR